MGENNKKVSVFRKLSMFAFGRNERKLSKKLKTEVEDTRVTADESAYSLADAKKIAEKGIAWEAKEAAILDKEATAYKLTLEYKFHDLLRNMESSANALDKTQLYHLFNEDFKLDISDDLFEKLFNLMDCDGNGTVDEQEFAVTMCFLLHKGSAHDKIELAYKLFDTNKDGSISKREFSDMISSILGPHLKNIVEIPGGKESFKAFVEKEMAGELFSYYEEISDQKKTYGEDGIPMNIAENIVDMYIKVDSDMQVNISADQREEIEKSIKKGKEEDADKVPFSVFQPSFMETISLLETGPLPRFKKAIKTPPYEIFTTRAWNICDLEEKEDMSLEKFKEFSEKTPNLFQFLEELTEELEYDLFKD
mmetsp:Transcript_6832/g.8629  ORF Transcript_6832/g.8629 Transcript_6832/m.8629 type:complete len:365 (-) Transcript_6832:159-1253(-)|eukprot:CAMPEP_0204829494 /NCGR_PEP_ID=MMETSP1346-20131115/7698_1 /ASSEMBLY_ACC=CAM_ASM_000771 /TAXON_ID=215587 /ORGANISM="Aplanochytrium stocchinoi, Strain GSBS06" /LENGTH=364 /DNA_ID=CAMNT_0051959341 /DNA_START=203 /DNA_END=1297 /DNA_ORIENTATION=-